MPRNSFLERLALFRIAYARVQTYVGIVMFVLVFATFAATVYDSPHIVFIREAMGFVPFVVLSFVTVTLVGLVVAYFDMTSVYRRESAVGARFHPLTDVQAAMAALLLRQQGADGPTLRSVRAVMRARFDECGAGKQFESFLAAPTLRAGAWSRVGPGRHPRTRSRRS